MPDPLPLVGDEMTELLEASVQIWPTSPGFFSDWQGFCHRRAQAVRGRCNETILHVHMHMFGRMPNTLYEIP